MVLIEKRLIAVAGATGLQGGSVVRYLLQDGTFRIRGLTRHPESDKAKELQGKGVEVVFADFDDPASLTAALHGVYGVFGITNYWDSLDGEKETRQGNALVEAAKANINDVQHFVWSTVSAPPRDLEVKHWTSKVRVNDSLLASGVPRTSLYTTFYLENFLLFDFVKVARAPAEESASGAGSGSGSARYIANWPVLLSDGPIGGYSVHETGAYVLEAFKNPTKWIGKDMYIPPDVFTPRMYVKALNEVLEGKAVVELKEIDEASFQQSRSLGPGAEEMWSNMAAFYRANGKMRNLAPSDDDVSNAVDEEIEKSILPNRATIKDWVRQHADEILAAAL